MRGEMRAAGRAVARALRRPETYPSAIKEALFTGMNVALYPIGLMSEALEETASSLNGRFTRMLPLCYLDPEAAATPIVMLHGYFHNRSAFLVMRRALKRGGFRYVSTMNYNVIGHDVPELARQLADHVDVVLARTHATRVHLLGHSLGGLVARYYIQELGGSEKVHTCITLGTPHRGTYAAWVGRGKAARQLRPSSPLIEQLEASARPMPVRFVAYYSNLDGLVIPAGNAKITHPQLNARNVLVKDQGHLSLLISRELIRSVIATLSHPSDELAEPAVVTPLPRRAARAKARSKVAATRTPAEEQA